MGPSVRCGIASLQAATGFYLGPALDAMQGGAPLPTTAFMSCLGFLPCADTDISCGDPPGKAADLAATW